MAGMVQLGQAGQPATPAQKAKAAKLNKKFAELFQSDPRYTSADAIMEQGRQANNGTALGAIAAGLAGGVSGYQKGKLGKEYGERQGTYNKDVAALFGAYKQGGDIGAIPVGEDASELQQQMMLADIEAQRSDASEEAKFQREAALKRELAAMKSGGSIEIDPDTGMVSFVPASDKGVSDPTPLANSLGVPAQPLDTRNMSSKDASMYAKQTRLKAEAQMGDEDYRAAASQARQNKQLAQEFQGLMEKQNTGGLLALPFAADVVGMYDPEVRRMKSIQDKLTPQQREAGSGSTSNFDAAMFANALMGADKPRETNEAIITANIARAEDTLKYQTFLSDYLTANGHINGADAAWQEYLDANPILDPTSPDKPVINKNRKSYQEFFGAQRGVPAATAAPNENVAFNPDIVRQKLTAKGIPPQRIEAYIKSKVGQ